MKRRIYAILIFAIALVAGIMFFGAKYYKFGLSIDNLIFLFAKPLDGTDPKVVKMLVLDSVTYIVLPSILVAIFISFLPKILLCRWAKKCYEILILFVNALLLRSASFSLCVSVCFFIIAFEMADSKLQIAESIKEKLSRKVHYSNFYEEHYITPKISDFKAPKNKRNLIVIFAESMESTYSSKNIPSGGGRNEILRYSPHGELIPNLTQFAQDGVNFSVNSVVGGHLESAGATPTFPSITSYMCGFPPRALFSVKNPKQTTCISDILNANGYFNAIFTGARIIFGGYDDFAKEHNLEAFDVRYFKENGLVASDYEGHWGLEDAKLFALTKDFLRDYDKDKPFALFISTIDTHFPGFVDGEFCAELPFAGLDSGSGGALYENAIRCGDKIIGDFVEFVKKSRFGDRTTIVILGDHLTMQPDFIPQDAHRFVYNVFINPNFSKTPTRNYVKNRSLTNYDFTALMMDALGFRVEAFGLGRNPLYSQTLVEKYGLDTLNRELKYRTKFFDKNAE
ncbi:LTA synthase family protein [Helicobacter sp. 23-1045]